MFFTVRKTDAVLIEKVISQLTMMEDAAMEQDLDVVSYISGSFTNC